MRRDQFVAERQERWAALEALLERAHRSVRRLTGDEVFQLGQLYLAATADLATARRDFPNDEVTRYLNDLVARAHPIVYQERAGTLARIGRFLRYGFPAVYRRALPYTALAFAAFAVPAIISAILVTIHPATADLLLPGEAQGVRTVLEHHQLWMKANTSNHPLAANFIMVNNITIALLAFAGGILLGVPALYVEATNGINIGVIAAMVAHYGLSEGLWSFVFPHGVIELSVIFMAGGAGMMIGDSVLRPGLRRRRDALVTASRDALQLALGGACLLVVAGTIEGFFSPSDAPDWSKYLVGILSGILLYSYLLGSRPRRKPRRYAFEDVIGPVQAELAGEAV